MPPDDAAAIALRKPSNAAEAGAAGSADLGDGERDADGDEGERGYDGPPERSGGAELQ
jgi:hypothetical protein